MNCPRCARPLTSHRTSRVLLQGCLGCGGLWLETNARNEVVKHLDADVLSAADLAAQHGRAAVDVARKGIACPTCKAPMQHQHVGAGKIDVDVCEVHGTWFDRDELQALMRGLQSQRASPSKPKPEGKRKKRNRAAVAGVAAAAGVGAAAAVATSSSAGEVIADVAGEVAIEGAFELLSALFD